MQKLRGCAETVNRVSTERPSKSDAIRRLAAEEPELGFAEIARRVGCHRSLPKFVLDQGRRARVYAARRAFENDRYRSDLKWAEKRREAARRRRASRLNAERTP